MEKFYLPPIFIPCTLAQNLLLGCCSAVSLWYHWMPLGFTNKPLSLRSLRLQANRETLNRFNFLDNYQSRNWAEKKNFFFFKATLWVLTFQVGNWSYSNVDLNGLPCNFFLMQGVTFFLPLGELRVCYWEVAQSFKELAFWLVPAWVKCWDLILAKDFKVGMEGQLVVIIRKITTHLLCKLQGDTKDVTKRSL